jgi:Tol biopolymer transport system component
MVLPDLLGVPMVKIAFNRLVDDKMQVYTLMDGGEAVQLTKHKYGASNPKWSPDGNKILFNSIPLKIYWIRF